WITFQTNDVKIKYIPLGHKDPIMEINKINDDARYSTILLLDAFDEDSKAVLNYKSRLTEILEATEQFKEIIITCRTQFFPNQLEEPFNTGLMKYGGGKGLH